MRRWRLIARAEKVLLNNLPVISSPLTVSLPFERPIRLSEAEHIAGHGTLDRPRVGRPARPMPPCSPPSCRTDPSTFGPCCSRSERKPQAIARLDITHGPLPGSRHVHRHQRLLDPIRTRAAGAARQRCHENHPGDGSSSLRSLALRQEASDQLEQVARAVGLGQIGGGPGLQRLLLVAAQGEGRDGDDRRGGRGRSPGACGWPRCRRPWEAGRPSGSGPDALAARWPCRSPRRAPRAGGRRCASGDPGRVRRFTSLSSTYRMVLALMRPSPASRRNGIEKKNVDPRPTSLSTQIRPPCISTNFLAMLSPSPVPRTRGRSSRRPAGTRRRGGRSAPVGMPIPVSDTRKRSASSRRSTPISTRPCRVNLSALPARFTRHW